MCPDPILVLTPHYSTVPNLYVKVVKPFMYTQADDVIMGLGTGRVPGVRSAGPRGNRTSGGFFLPHASSVFQVKSSREVKRKTASVNRFITVASCISVVCPPSPPQRTGPMAMSHMDPLERDSDSEVSAVLQHHVRPTAGSTGTFHPLPSLPASLVQSNIVSINFW